MVMPLYARGYLGVRRAKKSSKNQRGFYAALLIGAAILGEAIVFRDFPQKKSIYYHELTSIFLAG